MKVKILLLLLVFVSSCGKNTVDEQEEVAQSVGDLVSSFDEGAQGGAFAFNLPRIRKGPDYYYAQIYNFLIPNASAAACWTQTFSSCSSGVMERNFNNCTMGLGLFAVAGTVTLNFSNTLCSFAVNDSITRTADFTLTGRLGGTLTVTSPGGGQVTTRTALTAFSFESKGMNRTLSFNGKEIFNIDTSTPTPLTINGSIRQGRTIDGGEVKIVHNTKGYTATLSPSGVTWDTTCTCPTSGSWSGSVTEGEKEIASSFTVTHLESCGKYEITIGSGSDAEVTGSGTLERCSTL